MEDQQPGPGDLTEPSSGAAEPEADESEAVEPESAESEPDENEAAESDADEKATDEGETAESETAEAEGESDAVELPARRGTGRRLAVAAAISAALFVGAAAFAGAAIQPYLADRAQVVVKLDVARTAAKAINTLWNYTPENMDTLVDRASIYLSGDLEAQYRKFIDAIAESNKQAKVTDHTEIVGAAVESLDGPQATVIVYTNTSATSELNKSIPSMKYLSYRLFMKRDHGRWVITRMPTITSLDLTPHM